MCTWEGIFGCILHFGRKKHTSTESTKVSQTQGKKVTRVKQNPLGRDNDTADEWTKTECTACGATDQKQCFESSSVCSFVNRWSVYGPKQSTGSQSPLSPLSNCCLSNLSLMPRWAPGKSCWHPPPTHPTPPQCLCRIKSVCATKAYRLLAALWALLRIVHFSLTTGLDQQILVLTRAIMR